MQRHPARRVRGSRPKLVDLRHDDIPPPLDVVFESHQHEKHEHHHPRETGNLPDPKRQRSTPRGLEEKEDQVPSIENGDGKEVDDAEVDRDDGHGPDEVRDAPCPGLPGDVVNRDGSTDARE